MTQHDGQCTTGESRLADAAVRVDAFDADGVERTGDVEASIFDDGIDIDIPLALTAPSVESLLTETLHLLGHDPAYAAVGATILSTFHLFQHLIQSIPIINFLMGILVVD